MVSMMNSSILDTDVKEFCIHVMKKLIERTQNDETKTINKNAVYEEACASSSGIGALTLVILLSKTVFLRNYLQEDISAKVIILMKSKLQT
jgi:hypothetical protein